MPLPEDWRAFIESLNSHGVEYLVVGAEAELACQVYNYYYVGMAHPSSCDLPTQGTSGNNGNVVGYFFQDNSGTPSFGHTASYTYDSLNRLASSVATGSQTHNLDFTSDQWGERRLLDGRADAGAVRELEF